MIKQINCSQHFLYGLIFILFAQEGLGQKVKFGASDSTNIEFVTFDTNTCRVKIFSSPEKLDSLYSGTKEVICYIPLFLVSDVENVLKLSKEEEEASVKILAKIKYEEGIKVKAEGFYESGERYCEIFFNEHGVNGIVRRWFENGQPLDFYVCEDDKIISPMISWYSNGMLQSFYDYKRGMRTYKSWSINGVLLDESQAFNVDDPDSFIYKSYYSTGELKSEEIANSGIQPFKFYWKNGNLSQKGNILNLPLLRLGKWEEWYEDGTLKREMFYHDSIPNYAVGTWKYYSEKGELIKEEVYEKNELIDTKEYLPLKIKMKKD
ncbi:MAG: hypothetical protein VR77_01320 [Flavobacteriales bacterium BRH_c54]|nr:MAG: hypothetical protein VR77_01320 [Flavobacteriales bacterium BRH_c54]